jgi:hypothetical protein
MSPWSPRAFRPARLEEPLADPAAEQAVAERLLATAREVLLVPGKTGAGDAVALVERQAVQAHTEVLCGPEAGADLIDRLLSRGFTVYDAAAAPDHSVLVLDRRLGWRIPPWEPLSGARSVAHRLLWTRLGQYSLQSGTVDAVHPENRLFSLRELPFWVNTAYRDLALPNRGEAVRVVGLFSSLGGRIPMLHALRIDPLSAEPSGSGC